MIPSSASSPVAVVLFSGGFLSPLGLLALLGVVPILLLYLLEPDPERLRLPTTRFLLDDEGRDARDSGLRNLQRTLLLVLQVLFVVALAASLASPYLLVDERTTTEETVLVVDASASMATEAGGDARFDAAIDHALDETDGQTSIVVAGQRTRVPLRDGSSEAAAAVLDDLAVDHARGDLRDGVSQATAIASEDARIVVVSDFADDTDWPTAVQVARNRVGVVDLHQVDGGGDDNVGIVGTTYDEDRVIATVENAGEEHAERDLRLGEQSVPVSVAPGDVTTRTLDVPDGGGRLRLVPGDSVPVDDEVPIAAPGDPTIDVLLLTNDEDRHLRTALSVIDAVELTVERPPAAIDESYDVVIFGAVDPDAVLDGTVEVARETLRNGGGVVVQARPAVPEAGYGDLLLVDPSGTASDAASITVEDDELTRGVDFPPPDRHLQGDLAAGQSLVSTDDGSPLIARANRNGGRVLYYGYLGDASTFEHNYMFPVFWKRAVFDLAGRPSLSTLNRQTGESVVVPDDATVEAPGGTRAGPEVPLRQVGFYETADRTYGAAVLDSEASDVRTESIETASDGVVPETTERRLVPRALTPVVVGLAALLAILELAFLRRRGDL